jgi:predicted nucleotide-binding protein
MPYHVQIWPKSTEQQKLRELYAMNLSEEELRERIVAPYDAGEPITWEGRTLPGGDIATIKIGFTEHERVPHPRPGSFVSGEYEVVENSRIVTNDWITGPPGGSQGQPERLSDERASPDPRRVMVVHGRNLDAKDAIFAFLRSLALLPIEWEQAVREAGLGSPHNLEAVLAAMRSAKAVVVILTAEDRASILPALAAEGDQDLFLRGQPRQNVILEAGMAMGMKREGTILVEMGRIRTASDFDGLNAVRLTNANEARHALRSRLIGVRCKVDETSGDWMAAGDFESCLIHWHPEESPGDARADAVGAKRETSLRATLIDLRRRGATLKGEERIRFDAGPIDAWEASVVGALQQFGEHDLAQVFDASDPLFRVSALMGQTYDSKRRIEARLNRLDEIIKTLPADE